MSDKPKSNHNLERLFHSDDQYQLVTDNKVANASDAGFDEDTETFWSTWDKVKFMKPVELVTRVLSAHGYVVNFENIVSCLDQMIFGVRGKLKSVDSEAEVSEITSCYDVLAFKLPSKNRVGSLLNDFYSEIAGYEQKIAGMQEQAVDNQEQDSLREVQAELAKVGKENQELREQVKSLEVFIHRQAADIKDAKDEEVPLLPEDVHQGVVKAIKPKDRLITVRIQRKSWAVPMAMIQGIPEKGSPALLRIIDAKVQSAWFYLSSTADQNYAVAKVLFSSDGKIKIRDLNRKQWILQPSSLFEKKIFQDLSRGSMVLLTLFNGVIIKLLPLQEDQSRKLIDQVNESLAIQQLNESFFEDRE